MFINISNHPSPKWGTEQTGAAVALAGDIRDIAFPNVSPSMSFNDIEGLAATLAEGVGRGDCAMVSGEFSLTFALTRLLLSRGARVVVAATERRSVESTSADGTVTKTAIFAFVGFREII